MLAALIVLLVAPPADAASASFYLWRSKADSKSFCAQNRPGEGWSKAGGPFLDARCSRRSNTAAR
jgi:hypothetical protein